MTLPLDRHYKNVASLLTVEVFWGVSLALISMVAVLPVFLSQLGASNTVIGALPVVWILANAFSGPFAAYASAGLARRKGFVILLHVLAAIPYLGIAAWFGLMPRPSSTGVDIAFFIIAWGLSWVLMGFTIPVWINFIGKVTRPELRARSFGTIFFFQTLMGVIGGWVASRVLGSQLPFPANYAVGFLVAAVCMAAGAIFFVPVREEPGAVVERGTPLGTVVGYAREILADRSGLRVYLAALVLSTGSYLLVTYYPVYAEARFSLKPRDSALYVAVCSAGQMLGSILTGVIGDRFGYVRVAVIANGALVLGLVLALVGGNPSFYFMTAFVLGIFIVADMLALYNLSMAFSPHEDNTAYLGIIPALVAPMKALVAGSSGGLIDQFGFVPIALIGLGGALIALYLVVARLPEPVYSLAGRRNPS